MKRFMLFVAMLPLFVACGNTQNVEEADDNGVEATESVEAEDATAVVESAEGTEVAEPSKMDRFIDSAREAATIGGEIISDGAAVVIEKGGELYHQAEQEVGEVIDVVKERGSDDWENAKRKSGQVYDIVIEEGSDVVDRVRETLAE